MLRFNKKEWAVKYDRSIDLDDLEIRLERNQYYMKIGEADRQAVQTAFVINLIAGFTIGVIFTIIFLFLIFSPWIVPVILIKGWCS